MTFFRLVDVRSEDIILEFMRRYSAQDELVSIDRMMLEEVLPGDATREAYEAALERLVAEWRLERVE